MALSLHEILDMPAFHDAKVVAGKDHLDAMVTGVTIMEAPDIVNWMTGGEMLLTSLYSVYTDADAQRELVTRLVEKNVSALVIKTRRFIENISHEIIDSSNRLGLPVIELPGDVKFTDVMYPIMSELFNLQLSKLNYYKQVHDRFTSLSLASEGYGTIIQTLKELISNPVSLHDKNYQCIASTDPELTTLHPMGANLEREYLSEAFSYYRQILPATADNPAERTQVIVPIRNLNQTKIYLCVSETEKRLGELDYIPLEHAVTVLKLEMLKKFAVMEVEQKFKNDLIEDIVMEHIISLESAFERAAVIGWDLEKPYTVTVINLGNIDALVQDAADHRGMLFQKVKREMFNVIQDETNRICRGAILGQLRDSIVILWPEGLCENDPNMTLKKATTRLNKTISRQFPDLNVAIGIGSPTVTLDDIAGSYKEARDAIEFGRIIYGDQFILEFNELGVCRLLCRYGERENLEEFIPESLNQLLEYDREHQTELINTLDAFLNCNGNASRASKELFIHYKTILYRLEKIKKMINSDLEDSKDRLELELGLKMLHLLKKIP